MALCALVPSAHALPPVVPVCFRGEWVDSRAAGGECRFTFALRLARGPRAAGTFAWTLVTCPGLEDRVGSLGTEYVVGTADARQAELRGVRVSDPNLLATDIYRLTFAGSSLRGTTRTNNGDWSGRIQGERIPCAN